MKSINYYVSIISEDKIIKPGIYKVGKTLPAGEYYMWGNNIWYSYSRNNSRYSSEESEDCYVTLDKNDIFELEEGLMSPIENIVYREKVNSKILIPGHVYRVDREIPTGYYLYKFDKKYFVEKEVFLEEDECGVDMYENYSDSRFSRERGRFGCFEITSLKKYIVLKNGFAEYYGDKKFDEFKYIESQENSFNEFYMNGKILLSNKAVDLRIFNKYLGGRFCGPIVMNVYNYYWYTINGICKWTAKILPFSFQQVRRLKFDFYTPDGLVCHKKIEGFQDIRYKKDAEYGPCYIIKTELTEEFYGKELSIILREVNDIVVSEELEDYVDDVSRLNGIEIRKQFDREFMVMKNLLDKIGEIDVEKELTYFEKAPDLLNYIILALKDVIEAKESHRQGFTNKKITFRVYATYNKAFYCAAKIADLAENVQPLFDSTEFDVTFDSSQLSEIELMSYLLFDGKQDEDIAIRDFLVKWSDKYYTINRMNQCITELNNAYGYSNVVTNSVLIRIIKNENKKMQRAIDKIYSNVVKENRVPTKWGNEYRLFSLISNYNANAVYQFHSDWLGKQSLDIYIDNERIGIEYQGEQHYKAVDIFGGDAGLEANQERDARKKELCKRNDIRLLEWSYQIPVNDENVKKFMLDNAILFTKEDMITEIYDSVMAPKILPPKKIAGNKNSHAISKASNGDKSVASKYYIIQYDSSGQYVDKFLNIASAAQAVGVSSTSISKVLRGERNSAAGYIWKKINTNEEIQESIDGVTRGRG